ncbi:unnamed protein product [marine sediment metagenome]|uniref:Uncharacterized protein n=1 Tax=marine sediment metagenome TaxID=412755 RepID=X1J8M4_9ZZZZ
MEKAQKKITQFSDLKELGYRKLPEGIHLKLIEWEGKPAVLFDDGDVFFQSQTIGELLMHLSILMPNCELPDDIYIKG